MQENEVRELLERLLAAMDPAVEYEHRHEDYVVDMPQSGERMTRDGLRAMQEAFPGGPPKITLEHLMGSGDQWAGFSTIRYSDGPTAFGVAFIQFRDGKMWRETRFYAEPFEAPAWRAQWVEKIR